MINHLLKMRSFFYPPQPHNHHKPLKNKHLNHIPHFWHIPSKAQEKHKNDDDIIPLIGPACMHVAFL